MTVAFRVLLVCAALSACDRGLSGAEVTVNVEQVRFVSWDDDHVQVGVLEPEGVVEADAFATPGSIQQVDWLDPTRAVAMLDDGRVAELADRTLTLLPPIPDSTWRTAGPDGSEPIASQWELLISGGDVWIGNCRWGEARDADPCHAEAWQYARVSPAPIVVTDERPVPDVRDAPEVVAPDDITVTRVVDSEARPGIECRRRDGYTQRIPDPDDPASAYLVSVGDPRWIAATPAVFEVDVTHLEEDAVTTTISVVDCVGQEGAVVAGPPGWLGIPSGDAVTVQRSATPVVELRTDHVSFAPASAPGRRIVTAVAPVGWIVLDGELLYVGVIAIVTALIGAWSWRRRRDPLRTLRDGSAAVVATYVALLLLGQLCLSLQLGPDEPSAHQQNGLTDEERLEPSHPGRLPSSLVVGSALPGARSTSLHRIELATSMWMVGCAEVDLALGAGDDVVATFRNDCGVRRRCTVITSDVPLARELSITDTARTVDVAADTAQSLTFPMLRTDLVRPRSLPPFRRHCD